MITPTTQVVVIKFDSVCNQVNAVMLAVVLSFLDMHAQNKIRN